MAEDPLDAFNEIVDPIIREEEAHRSAAQVYRESRRAYLAATVKQAAGDINSVLHDLRTDVAAVFTRDRA